MIEIAAKIIALFTAAILFWFAGVLYGEPNNPEDSLEEKSQIMAAILVFAIIAMVIGGSI